MRGPEETAFTEFAATAVLRLRRTAYLMCGDWHRAEDATQDALVRLYGAWPRLERNPASLSVYAHKTLVSAVRDQARRPWRREHALDMDFTAITGPDPTETVDNRRLVAAALGALPRRQRACVVLRHYADLSVAETAEVLRISTGSVKSLTSRGLAKLRQDLSGAKTETSDHSERTLSWIS